MPRQAHRQSVFARVRAVIDITGPGAHQLQARAAASVGNSSAKIGYARVERISAVDQDELDFRSRQSHCDTELVLGLYASVLVKIRDELFDDDGQARHVFTIQAPSFRKFASGDRRIMRGRCTGQTET